MDAVRQRPEWNGEARRPVDVCSARTGAERRSQRPLDAVRQRPERSEETRMFESGRTRFNKKDIHRMPFLLKESARRDSNPRPRPWQGRAPPTEPLAHRLLCRLCLPDTFDIIQHELQFVNTKFEIFMQIFRRHTIKKLTPNAIPHKIKSRDIKNVKVG